MSDSDKARKILNEAFIESTEEIAEDEAQNLVVVSLQKIRMLEDEQRNDDKLKAAKQIKTDLEAGYKSAIQYEKAKISFLLDKIQEIQDGDVNPSSGLNSVG